MDGKVYRIICGDRFYYGSCITSIARRAITHRFRAKTKSNKLYDFIKNKDWSIELVKAVACATQAELRLEEDKFVREHLTNPLCLNERSAVWDVEKDITRKKEWYKKNRERLLEKAKARYEAKKAPQ